MSVLMGKITSMAELRKLRRIHAMIYFINNTKRCHLLKLLKLLYLLDFETFRLTGQTVTHLEYEAWDKGPVPRKLYNSIKNNDKSLEGYIKIIPKSLKKNEAINFQTLIDFNSELFSKREIKTMEKLVEVYKDSKAKEMTAVTHQDEEGRPWSKAYEKGKRNLISLKDVLDSKKPGTISKAKFEILKELGQPFR